MLLGGSFLYMGDGGRSGAYSGQTAKPSPSRLLVDRARNINPGGGKQAKRFRRFVKVIARISLVQSQERAAK